MEPSIFNKSEQLMDNFIRQIKMTSFVANRCALVSKHDYLRPSAALLPRPLSPTSADSNWLLMRVWDGPHRASARIRDAGVCPHDRSDVTPVGRVFPNRRWMIGGRSIRTDGMAGREPAQPTHREKMEAASWLPTYRQSLWALDNT